MKYPKEYPKEFRSTWEAIHSDGLRAQVAEVIQELYGQPPGVSEEEVREFCRLGKFREFMLKAFVPSKKG